MEKVPEKKTQGALSFRPLSDGLGFHPFSDGLPYAPVGKTGGAAKQAPPTTGTGALSAGPATYSPPPAYTPAQPGHQRSGRISVPVAAPSVPVRPAGIATPQATQTVAKQPASAPAVTSASIDPQLEHTYGYGYLAKRAVAWILDSTLNLVLCVGALSVALWGQDMNTEALLTPGVAVLAILFIALFSWALITAQEVAFGTSVGKRLFGLHLQGTASAIFLRAFFFLPSIGFCGLGLLWSLIDRRKRCWHDVVVDLQPVEYASL